MIKKLKLWALSLSSIILLAVPLMAGGVASAAINQNDINGQLCAGSNGTFGGANDTSCSGAGATNSVNQLITTIINVISVIVGVIAVIMIIVAGLRYVTSGGKEEGVKNAKNTILYAIIGLVIVALAQIIVHYVLNKTTTATGSGT